MTADPVLPPGGVLALFDASPDDDCRLQVLGRPPVPRDGVDAVAELAVLVAATRLPRAAFLIPSRMRDLVDDVEVAAPIVVTRGQRLADGRVELDVLALAGADLPRPGGELDVVRRPGLALEPGLSPVGSLLCEALRSDEAADLAPAAVAAVLRSWGHTVVAHPALPDVDRATLGRTRYRVHRLAREWSERHRPMALAGTDRRPAAPANLPVGFVPACPL